MSKIMHIGTLHCAPDEVDTLTTLLGPHVALSRAEPGCLSYELFQDEVQLTTFQLNAVFRDRQAFEAHKARVESADWGRATAHMRTDFHERSA